MKHFPYLFRYLNLIRESVSKIFVNIAIWTDATLFANTKMVPMEGVEMKCVPENSRKNLKNSALWTSIMSTEETLPQVNIVLSKAMNLSMSLITPMLGHVFESDIPGVGEPSASDMEEVVWDDEIARVAQRFLSEVKNNLLTFILDGLISVMG